MVRFLKWKIETTRKKMETETFIGETGRKLGTWISEHKKDYETSRQISASDAYMTKQSRKTMYQIGKMSKFVKNKRIRTDSMEWQYTMNRDVV